MYANRCCLPQPGTRDGVDWRAWSSGWRLPPSRRPYEQVDWPDRLTGADHRHGRRPRVIKRCEPVFPPAFPAQSSLLPIVRTIARYLDIRHDVISQRAVQWLWNGSAKTQIVSEEFVNYKTLSFSIVYIPFDTSRVIARQFLGS